MIGDRSLRADDGAAETSSTSLGGGLTVLRLGATSQAVYLEMLSAHRATADGLADDLKLDEEATRGALEHLRERGLITRAAGDSSVYILVDPRDALSVEADRVADAVSLLRRRFPAYGARFDQLRRAVDNSPTETRMVTDEAELSGWYAQLRNARATISSSSTAPVRVVANRTP